MLAEFYDRPADGPPHLEGRAVQRGLTQARINEVLRLLPPFLAEDGDRTTNAGWCLATEELLVHLRAKKWLSVELFRKAVLANNDVMSSVLDESQPTKDNTWGLVVYEDRGSYYMCVMQVLYYARVAARSAGMKGFDPALCEQYRVPVPAEVHPHRPLRFAVGRVWLATACDAHKGALGCREAYDPDTGLPPDMVGVRNMATAGPLVQGSSRRVLASGTRSRYYGICCVPLDAICCQVGPTVAEPGDPVQCFLVCSKKSGKR